MGIAEQAAIGEEISRISAPIVEMTGAGAIIWERKPVASYSCLREIDDKISQLQRSIDATTQQIQDLTALKAELAGKGLKA